MEIDYRQDGSFLYRLLVLFGRSYKKNLYKNRMEHAATRMKQRDGIVVDATLPVVNAKPVVVV